MYVPHFVYPFIHQWELGLLLLFSFLFFFFATQLVDLGPPTRDGTCAPALGAWYLNYWIAREVPASTFWQIMLL